MGWSLARRAAEDRRLLEDALEALERANCQFWACEGPARPGAMKQCHVCWMIARLRRRLGIPVRQGVEGSFSLSEERRRADLARATAGPSPDGCTTIVWRS